MKEQHNDVVQDVHNPDDLARLADGRATTRRGRRAAYRDLAEDYLEGDETVLEVGSGTGALRDAWPADSYDRWIELDINAANLREAAARRPGTYVTGSAYDLPVSDDRVDAVTGVLSYTDLFDLDQAAAEAARAARPGGRFLHVIDMVPNTPAIRQRIEEQDGGTYVSTTRLADRLATVDVAAAEPLEDWQIEQLDRFLADGADVLLEDRTARVPASDDGWAALDDATVLDIARTAAVHGRAIYLEDAFNGMLETALEPYSVPGSVETGHLIGKHRGPRTEEQAAIGDRFFSAGMYDIDPGERPAPPSRDESIEWVGMHYVTAELDDS